MCVYEACHLACHAASTASCFFTSLPLRLCTKPGLFPAWVLLYKAMRLSCVVAASLGMPVLYCSSQELPVLSGS